MKVSLTYIFASTCFGNRTQWSAAEYNYNVALFYAHERDFQHINICFKIYLHSQRNKNHRTTKIVASLELHQWFQKCYLLIPHSPF